MIKLITSNITGVLGVEKTKGLFIDYNSYKHGKIRLEFFKSRLNGVNYYLIDNQNISSYPSGSYNDDVMIIHDKIEKLINMILKGKDYTSVRSTYNKLFKYKKYNYDDFDINDFIIYLSNETILTELKTYIQAINEVIK